MTNSIVNINEQSILVINIFQNYHIFHIHHSIDRPKAPVPIYEIMINIISISYLNAFQLRTCVERLTKVSNREATRLSYVFSL